MYQCLPLNISRKSAPLIWPLLFSWKETEKSTLLILPLPVFPCWPICGCLDKARCGRVLGAGIWKNRILVCSSLLAYCVISRQSFSFSTSVFPSRSDCGSFAWGAPAPQRGWASVGEMLGLGEEEEEQWGEDVAFWQQQTLRRAQLLTRPHC